jgi:ATP-binding cassette subfamily B protein
MDDSTSSVDSETEVEIREKLVNLMKNRTTFIIAHRIQSIMDADLILVMDHGRIVQRGRHEELIREDGIYKKIYEIQSQVELDLEKELGNVN